MKPILIKPIISDKASSAIKLRNVYTILVNKNSNKLEIKKEFEERYSISVENIKTMIYTSKKIKKHTKNGLFLGKKNKIKKAILKLPADKVIYF